MKVILLGHVKNVGQKGEIKEVPNGYYHNFLAPRKLAAPATATQVEHIHAQQAKAVEKLEMIKESAEAVKAKVEGKTVEISVKASEAGKLYASIHAKEVAQIIRSQLNVEIPEKNIEMESIKATGNFAVKLKLFKGLDAQLTVHVTAA